MGDVENLVVYLIILMLMLLWVFITELATLQDVIGRFVSFLLSIYVLILRIILNYLYILGLIFFTLMFFLHVKVVLHFFLAYCVLRLQYVKVVIL